MPGFCCNFILMFKSMTKNWLWTIGIWSLVALFTGTQLYFKTIQAGGDASWFKLFYIQLLVWNAWGALTPLIFWLARKYRMDRQKYLKALAIHIPMAVMIVLTYLAFYSVIWNLLGGGILNLENFKSYFKLFFVNLFHWHFFIYMTIVGIIHAMEYYKESKAHELEAIELEKELVLNQLNTLKIQLQPHFLFNTLNNVVSSIRQKKEETAVNMLTDLGQLLRTTLLESNKEFSTLKEEISFIQSYLSIENHRFKDLMTTFDVPKNCEGALIPNFILQPIVENAIKHGIAKKSSAKRIETSAQCYDDLLKILVYNEGPALTGTDSSGLGVGVPNTRERLRKLYADRASFELIAANDGVIAELILPLKFDEKN